MKRARLIGYGLLLGLGLALLLGGGLLLLRQTLSESSFEVEGRVAGFGNDARTVIIEHEEIPGYMSPMTMPFTAADTTALDRLHVGDAVGFRLHTNGDSSWITEVQQLPDSSVAQHPAAASSPRYTRTAKQPALQAGDASPGFTLSRDLHGDTVRTTDYRGKALLLNFIYTRCPLPEYCPRLSKNFARIQAQLPDSLSSRVQLLSVSFDPERDTPQVLRDYANRYEADTTNWTFATGTPDQVERITNRFGVFTKQDGGEITHNLRTVLIGPDGRIQRIWSGTDWQPEEALTATRQTLRSDGTGTKAEDNTSQSLQ